MSAFEVPDRNDIADLSSSASNQSQTIRDSDLVLCINRGRKPLKETFDSAHHEIPVGYFKTEFGRALHYQRKLIVPGTRNIEVGGHVSFIGILGTDDGRVAYDTPENCVPFTDEELTTFGERIEAIDRSAFSSEADREVVPVKTRNLGGVRRGGSMKPNVDVSQQASEAAKEAAAHVFEPSDEPNLAKQDQLAASTEQSDEDGGEAPQPRPMRSQRKR